MSGSLIVTGIPALDRKIKAIGKAAPKIARKAMRVGMKTVAQETKTQVPVDTGLTKANVKVRALKKRKRNAIGIEVRIASAPGLYKKSKIGTVFYPAVIEYGRRGVAPDPFGRRAYESKGESARQLTLQELRDGVEAEARR